MTGKDTHPFIGQGVDQVQDAAGERRDADKEQIVAVQETAGVPREDEDHQCDKDAEQLDKAVEEDVVVQAARIKTERNEST